MYKRDEKSATQYFECALFNVRWRVQDLASVCTHILCMCVYVQWAGASHLVSTCADEFKSPSTTIIIIIVRRRGNQGANDGVGGGRLNHNSKRQQNKTAVWWCGKREYSSVRLLPPSHVQQRKEDMQSTLVKEREREEDERAHSSTRCRAGHWRMTKQEIQSHSTPRNFCPSNAHYIP